MDLQKATKVPVISKRKRIPKQAISAVVHQIAERFHPKKIILFGSYAYGKPRPESDVDLLVIMETKLKETEQAVLIYQEIEYHFGLDLIVKTPENLSKRLALGDPFISEVVNKGKILYESSHN